MTTSRDGKRAALHTLGCRLNQAETLTIRARLEAAGYAIVPFGEPADLGIVNTCTVTREADAKSRKLIRAFARENPEAFLAVIGCYSQVAAKAIAEIGGVDLIIGNRDKLDVLDYVAEGKNDVPVIVCGQVERGDFTVDTTAVATFSRRPNLKIQDGCDFMCSFCVVPFARGRARSRVMSNLLDEASQLVADGARELVLTGVNVGTYRSEGQSIVDVIDKLNALEGLERIRISSIEPTTIPEAVLDAMAAPEHALVPHLHVPLQSASNRVLGLMKRKYTAEEYLEFIVAAAARIPNVSIGTDILVGMPGETEEDFEATCSLLEAAPIAYAHVFKYSERPGTAALRQPGKVAPKTKNSRSARIRQIAAGKLEAFHARHIGRTHSVLFEGQEDGQYVGYTENYIRVAVPSDAILGNRVRDVTLLESCGGIMTGRCTLETPSEAVL